MPNTLIYEVPASDNIGWSDVRFKRAGSQLIEIVDASNNTAFMPVANISGINEAIDDRVGALIVGLSGIGVTYHDSLNQLQIFYSGVVGAGGSGISTLNTLTNTTQTFATGVAGTNFNIVSAGSTHTFNIPDATGGARGLVSTSGQVFNGYKYFNNGIGVEEAAGVVFNDGATSTSPRLYYQNANILGVIAEDNATACSFIATGFLSGQYLMIGSGFSSRLENDQVKNSLKFGDTTNPGDLRLYGNTSVNWRRLRLLSSSSGVNTFFAEGNGTSAHGNNFIFNANGGLQEFSIGSSGYLTIGSAGAGAPTIYTAQNSSSTPFEGGRSLTFFTNISGASDAAFNFTGTTSTLTGGFESLLYLNKTFAPTTGTAEFRMLHLQPTINQTGGSTGIVRGIYIQPSITNAPDFRSIETTGGRPMFNMGIASGGSAPFQITQTWNNAATTFNGLLMDITDTASNTSSNFFNFRISGVSQFAMTRLRRINIGPNTGTNCINLTPSGGDSFIGFYKPDGTQAGTISYGGLVIGAAGSNDLRFSSSTTAGFGIYNSLLNATSYWDVRDSASNSIVKVTNSQAILSYIPLAFGNNPASPDIFLHRNSANHLEQRNAANPQSQSLYGTYTDSGNYRRVRSFVSTQGSGFFYAEGLTASAANTGNTLNFFTDTALRLKLDSTNADFGTTNIRLLSNTGYIGIGSGNPDVGIHRVASGLLRVCGHSTSVGGVLNLIEVTAPSAPSTDGVYVYGENNGTGRTRLMAKFATGRTSALAIENPEVLYIPTSGTQIVELKNGPYQVLSLESTSGNITAFINIPDANETGTILVRQHGSTARNITWTPTSGTVKWLGTQPTWSSDPVSGYRIVSWRWHTSGNILFMASTDSGT